MHEQHSATELRPTRQEQNGATDSPRNLAATAGRHSPDAAYATGNHGTGYITRPRTPATTSLNRHKIGDR